MPGTNKFFGILASVFISGSFLLRLQSIDGAVINKLSRTLLSEMECHEHAWPFLMPVNTKHLPQYRKVIKCPMDLSTIKRKLHDGT